MFKIDMLSKVEDSVTGFKGTVTGRTEYVTGCRQYLVQSKMKKGENKYPDARWIDEDRLVVKGKPEVVETTTKKGKPKGGPQQFAAPVK